MSTAAVPVPQDWHPPDRGAVGIASFIVGEAALFLMFLIGYLFFLGKNLNGPYPAQVLETPVFITICLLSSSATIVVGERALRRGAVRKFLVWLGVTMLLALIFLTGTGLEWRKLIVDDHLTIATNVFGTTFYSLVGLHATHVTVGVIFMTIALLSSLTGFPIQTQERRVMFLSWYWHFVDIVWVFVFLVVYVIGK